MNQPLLNLSYPEQCRCCGKVERIVANVNDFIAWQGGSLIQDAMPYLSAGGRELLVSKTCEPCFDAMFAECE